MAKRKMSNEFKTGVIVAAAIAVGIIFLVKTTDFSAHPYRIKVYFNYAEGIKEDSIVKLSGIEVGRVESIRFQYAPDTKIELVLNVDKKAKVREDSIAFISTSGMIGDAYIGITPGSADKAFVKDGGTIESEDPVELRKMMKKAETISENLEKALQEVKLLAGSVNDAVAANRQRIDNIAVDLECTATNFKEFSEDIKRHPWKLLVKGK